MSHRVNSDVGSINRVVSVNHSFRRVVRGKLHVVKRNVRKFMNGSSIAFSSLSGRLTGPASLHMFTVTRTLRRKCAVSHVRSLAGVSP